MRLSHRPAAAFTMIELIAALIIVGLLSLVAAFGFSKLWHSAGEHSAPAVLEGVDAAARELAAENGAGYAFPLIGSECSTGAPGTTAVPAAGVSTSAAASTSSRVVSACVDTSTDTLYLAVVGSTGGCGVATDTIVPSSLPPSVAPASSTTTSPAGTSGADGARYGLATSSSPCSAVSLYNWVAAGNALSSTSPAAPTPVTMG